MYLVYKPDGQPERRWHVNINRLPLTELRMIQRASGLKINMFQQSLLIGDVDALQALLWVYLRREHATLRVDDVDFCLDELQLLRDRDEWQQEIDALAEDTDMSAMDRAAALAYARSELRKAPDAPGKAPESLSTPAVPEPTAPAAPPPPQPPVQWPPQPPVEWTTPPPVPVAVSMPVPGPSTT
jgi:hypothetical protein